MHCRQVARPASRRGSEWVTCSSSLASSSKAFAQSIHIFGFHDRSNCLRHSWIYMFICYRSTNIPVVNLIVRCSSSNVRKRSSTKDLLLNIQLGNVVPRLWYFAWHITLEHLWPNTSVNCLKSIGTLDLLPSVRYSNFDDSSYLVLKLEP